MIDYKIYVIPKPGRQTLNVSPCCLEERARKLREILKTVLGGKGEAGSNWEQDCEGCKLGCQFHHVTCLEGLPR